MSFSSLFHGVSDQLLHLPDVRHGILIHDLLFFSGGKSVILVISRKSTPARSDMPLNSYAFCFALFLIRASLIRRVRFSDVSVRLGSSDSSA